MRFVCFLRGGSGVIPFLRGDVAEKETLIIDGKFCLEGLQMLKTTKNSLKENGYDLSEEAKNATLFTTGNGYMGVRGSLEEFGSTKIQGAFIRGYIDEIIEIVEPFCDNIYMKKYYIDEEKLKHFETQLSCVNLPDFLLVRFKIGDKIFYPWKGEILSWERILDTARARLVRRVKWKDEEGNITEFTFERFASYSDKHKYFLRAVARPVGDRYRCPYERTENFEGFQKKKGRKERGSVLCFGKEIRFYRKNYCQFRFLRRRETLRFPFGRIGGLNL